MTNEKDLTPEEARAEIEAFLGPGWDVRVVQWPNGIAAEADRPGPVYVSGPCCPTYRAAVDALKQSWRDAVRPWVELSVKEGFIGGRSSTAVMGGRQTLNEKAAIVERILSRNVLKESDHE